MTATRVLAILAACLIVTGAATGSAAAIRTQAPSSLPRSLRGLPITGRTGLKLLIADDPPILLNVDTDQVTPIQGLRIKGQPVLGVSAVGDDTLVWLDYPRMEAAPRGEFYVIQHGSARATVLTSGWQAAPGRTRDSLWLISYVGARHCVLAELNLDGHTLRSPKPVSCSAQLVDSGSGAILVSGDTATDPATGETVLRGSTLWAISDGYALSSNASHAPLTLTNLRTGATRALPWPSPIGGTDQAVVNPRTGLIALDFADPAYGGSGTQVTDTWLLNPRTGRFTHLPGMPAAVHLKFTSMAWTSDDRLVTLAETGSGTVPQTLVAIWKPGQKHLHVRTVTLPQRTSGSDSFTITHT